MTLMTINGTELANEGSIEMALVHFYKAFNQQDLSLMEQNWLQKEEASMSNPLGGLKRGWSEIKTVYESIFNGPAEVYVEYHDFSIFDGDGFFAAVGRERGYFSIGGKSMDLKIRTSRTFVFQDGTYRQLHHHGSIESPELLASYQNAVRTGEIA